MKKVISLTLIFAICFSLCACGGEAAAPVQIAGSTEETVIEETVPMEDSNTIELDEPLVLMDNTYFKLELLRFWKKEEGFHPESSGSWKWEEGKPIYGADFQFYNKSESEYLVNPTVYIGDESALDHTDIGGQHSNSPLPGKNAIMQMTICRWDGSKELPIELEELYQLNGTVLLSGGIDAKEYTFSVPESMKIGGALDDGNDEEYIQLDKPLVLAENKNCRMELLGFWKTNGGWHATSHSGWGKGSKHTGPSFGVDIQFYNESQAEYDIHADAYIGNEMAACHLEIGDTSWEAPAPGKNALMKMTISRWDGEKEVPVSMDELYQLNGTIRISGGVNQKISFSIPDAIGSAAE